MDAAKIKRVIAREWIILVLFSALSPPIPILYHWAYAPKEKTDAVTDSRIEGKTWYFCYGSYDLVAVDEKHFRNFKAKLAESSDQVKAGKRHQDFSFERLLETQREAQMRLNYSDLIQTVNRFNAGEYLSQDEYPWQSEVLSCKKKPLRTHFLHEMRHPYSYMAILFTYSAFLFIRSIMWSIRTLRNRAP